MSLPSTTEAGILSFLTGKQEESDTLVSHNSQTIPILSTTISQNGVSRGGPEVVVNGDALLADTGPLGTAADIPESAPGEISVYVVKEGDTIPLLAKMFDVSTNTVIWSNGLKKDEKLIPGKELVILPVSGVRYTVKKGDTLDSIAKAYKGDADDIGSFNSISDTDLVVGMTVIIPDGEPEVIEKKIDTKKVATKTTPATKTTGSSGYYIRPIKIGVRSQGIHGANAVDLAAPTGTPIYASASGKIIVNKNNNAWNGGYGNYVVISHPNGSQTLYGHMVRTSTELGKTVEQGELIGYLGSTGRSTGPHVHFEIRGGIRNPF